MFRNNQFLLSNVPVPRVDAFSFENPTLDQLRYVLARRSYLFYFFHDVIYLRNAAKIKRSGDVRFRDSLAKAIFVEMKKTVEAKGAKLVTKCSIPTPGAISSWLRAFIIIY